MQQPSKIIEYLETVRQQIRWKRAQPIVLQEIENHIIDQKNAFLMDGYDEITATDKAIAEMGDPVVVGERLDRAHKPRPDWFLLALTVMMLLLGLAVQFFIGSQLSVAFMFEKQLIWAAIAILVMLAAYFTDFTILGKYLKLVIFIFLILETICFLFNKNDHGTLIQIYIIIPLLLFPTAFAGFVYSMRNRGYAGIILCEVVLIIPIFLSIVSNNVTLLFLIFISCLVIETGVILKGWFNVRKPLAILIIYFPITVFLSKLFLMINKGNSPSIQVMFNPSLDSTWTGYMGSMIQQFLSHSQFIGGGLPINSYQTLPESNTDFILTYLIYRFGWIIFIVIVTLLAIFIIRGIILCSKQKSVLGFLASLAIISTFTVQCIVYIASNLGFLFFSPLSLPLISYGGSALITNMFLIGLLLSVFRSGTLVGDKARIVTPKNNPFIQYNNGRIIIDLKSNPIK